MRRFAPLLSFVAALFLAACTPSAPPPTPVALKVPPPPEAEPGSIRVYGDHLPAERAEHIREKLRAAEPKLLTEYQTYLHEFPGIEGKMQLRIGVNDRGKTASIERVFSDLVSEGLGSAIRPTLEKIDYGAGPEAWVYYTLAFRPDPLEVLAIDADFAQGHPVLIAMVENRSAFRLPSVSATVTVMGPEKDKPLRIFRRTINTAFSPGERRELRIPIGSEWATARNSYLVTVAPVVAEGAIAKTTEP